MLLKELELVLPKFHPQQKKEMVLDIYICYEFIIKKMSSIINEDLFTQSYHSSAQLYQIPVKGLKNSSSSPSDIFIRMLTSVLKHYHIQNIKKLSTMELEAFLYITFSQKFAIITKISINFQTKLLTINFDFLWADNLVQIKNKTHIKMIIALLQKINIFNTFQNLIFYVSSNGVLHSKTYSTFIQGHHGHFILQKFIIQYIKLTERLMIEQVESIMEILGYKLLQYRLKQNSQVINLITMQSNSMMEVRDLLGLAHINLHDNLINSQEKRQRYILINQYLEQRNDSVGINNNQIFSKESQLYSQRFQESYYLGNKVTYDKVQTQLAKSYQPLFSTFQPFCAIQGENSFVYNTVTIKDEKQITTIKTHYEGGFSRFQLAQLQMAYSESTDPVLTFDVKESKAKAKDEKLWRKENNLIYLKKMVAIKMPKDKAAYQKIRHEKIIIQNLSNTVSPFLIKYYNAYQPNFSHRHHLLMDYFGDMPSLSKYHENNQEFMTLSSKLKIVMNLSRALLTLQSKSITHMDFTPHNIFITNDVIPKIIDFGQAYHPIIKTQKIKNYHPGYTLPYCPPQTFNKIKVFQSRSDMFSLGIILFKLLFNRIPYNISKQLQQSYMRGAYSQRFFLSPEELSHIYTSKISGLLLQLIMHCMLGDSKTRPYPFWVYIILIKIGQMLR